jgi:hypothetical protein
MVSSLQFPSSRRLRSERTQLGTLRGQAVPLADADDGFGQRARLLVAAPNLARLLRRRNDHQNCDTSPRDGWCVRQAGSR